MEWIDKMLFEVGVTQNVEGNMYESRIRTEYLQDLWTNRREGA